MRRCRASSWVAVVVGFLLVSAFCSVGFGQNFERTYLLVKGRTTYRLTVSVTPSLYEYYGQKSHHLNLHTFGSFVTPYSLAPMARDIRTIFPDDEGFVNAVLMLVRQIPYEVVVEGRYPVETIVENRGDCDLFSYIAASLIVAQGVEVVLFYYERESHMNIGVALSSPPESARTTVSYVDYGGVRYYVAECTGDDWRNGWRVGECPSELEGAQVTVVTLENCETVAPGQVSSSFGGLESSVISLEASQRLVVEGSPVILRGQVSVPDASGNITLYATAGGSWFVVGMVELDAEGCYMFSWTPSVWGQVYVKAFWSGNAEYAGADSEVVTVYVVPTSLVHVGAGVIIMVMAAVVVFLMLRSSRPQDVQVFEQA